MSLPPAFTRWIVLSSALLATVVAAVWPQGEENTAPEVVAPVTRRDDAPPKAQQSSALELPALGERLERARTAAKIPDLFNMKDWNPPPPPVRAKPLPPPPPTAPPFPYGISGSAADANGPMIVFNRQNQDFVLRVGDILEQTYRVEAIDPQSVTVTYLPLGLAQVMAIQR